VSSRCRRRVTNLLSIGVHVDQHIDERTIRLIHPQDVVPRSLYLNALASEEVHEFRGLRSSISHIYNIVVLAKLRLKPTSQVSRRP
jgi:hypothetical protein